MSKLPLIELTKTGSGSSTRLRLAKLLKNDKEIKHCMPFSIRRPIFAHDFLNPPREDRSCNIDIVITTPSSKLDLVKETPGLQTRYMLTIDDPSIIGLTSSEQAMVDKAVKDLILAFNLSLVRTCLSTVGANLYPAEVETKTPETKVTIEETPRGKNLKVVEAIGFRDSVYITIGTREEISEQRVIADLNKIIKVNRFSPTPSLERELNLSKALNEYEIAMSTFDRLRIFKSLYNTIEFCANWTGTDNRGPVLDANVAAITAIPQSDIEFWRDFYNRTKHVDRTTLEASTFVQGMEKLPEISPIIREAAKKLIADCMNRI
jgi:hypothetical protein